VLLIELHPLQALAQVFHRVGHARAGLATDETPIEHGYRY
jgi:hypothetical protein